MCLRDMGLVRQTVCLMVANVDGPASELQCMSNSVSFKICSRFSRHDTLYIPILHTSRTSMSYLAVVNPSNVRFDVFY
jgi:hypothetical protein